MWVINQAFDLFKSIEDGNIIKLLISSNYFSLNILSLPFSTSSVSSTRDNNVGGSYAFDFHGVVIYLACVWYNYFTIISNYLAFV